MTMDLRTGLAALALAAGLALPAAPALAEMSEITIARQPSIGHLPLMIMQERRLIETMAEAEGLGEVKVNYATFAGGSNMNDALLSNTIQFAAGGVPPLILLWSKTAGTSNEVKGVAAMNSMPLLMNVNREDIRSIEDFKPGDKIALPSVKVSVQAMVLQMAAAKIWGDENYGKLDPLTVSMSHPDGLAALLARQEVTAHFTASPAQDMALRAPGVHTVLNSFDVMGGPVTFNVVWTTKAFHDDNPKLFDIFRRALAQAVEVVNEDPAEAVQVYLRQAGNATDPELLASILADPQVDYTVEPSGIDKYLDFMRRIGTVKDNGQPWEAMFFE
ncbi:nitrate/sulfonate/bicarbonate ABC transporter periplasmic ligand-binding protein [Cereibacter sphaeroides WS8N]|uniref:ABC transporter substrate-binding protein n=1 Tax=Cereibacter sphaeroides TaxID=1063 RepID=UPI00020B01BA|nr:ABC transporter substrate-binding protein [Cereibacter sphaeroides]EGJ19884.1 nitrate/sulfonate/bicarbonate ABC transporter periplasmic ligand-binding protein [Cereibacter sphaeroides WS8N]